MEVPERQEMGIDRPRDVPMVVLEYHRQSGKCVASVAVPERERVKMNPMQETLGQWVCGTGLKTTVHVPF